MSNLGLDYLGLSGDEVRDVLEPIVSEAVQTLSRPTAEGIARKIVGQKHLFLKALASRLVESVERLDRERLEFIVQNAPEIAGKAAPALYEAAERLGAEDLVEELRMLWEAYGSPTRARCPKCGFKALTPDLWCLVCRRTSSEEEFKRSIGFESLLESWASRAPRELVEEVLRSSIIYYDDGTLAALSEPRSPLAIPLTLGSREKERLRRILQGKTRLG
ncbi:hypothetical protein [Aeropyrum camini]|uniref:Uncharacterized protein n=1 Tax=Aeropyrum camini SY1 = JCM 12091 TaxID=1198449 RepID=U3TCA0_9CREN|nr:hypothetical protein [Aeropyrum camini]BAN90061.1 hypothetical protein ACAM_0592 [Aeropyrum camini SY1 = JCM 12091]